MESVSSDVDLKTQHQMTSDKILVPCGFHFE